MAIDELYTELTLEKVDTKIQVVSDYQALFNGSEHDTGLPKKNMKKGKKSLAKADPGLGKTTFSKKIAYDWATGVFKTM